MTHYSEENAYSYFICKAGLLSKSQFSWKTCKWKSYVISRKHYQGLKFDFFFAETLWVLALKIWKSEPKPSSPNRYI